MKIVFMGTPDFALEALKALISGGHEIAAVVTGEDKPRGRGYEVSFTPVKQEALKHQIPVLQPENLKGDEIFNELKALAAEVFVVAAYGKLLPKRILELPPFGCINIHASLLPAYRGAAPVQWAIIDGLKKTGITTMLMNEGLDKGDLLRQYPTEIGERENAGELFDKLAALGGEAILDTLKDLKKGNIEPQKQNEAKSSYAAIIKKQLGRIDFSKSALSIERLVRGLNPWPSAYTRLDGKTLKIWRARVCEAALSADLKAEMEALSYGGLICAKERLFAVCSESLLEILELQLEGKKRMDTPAFLRGYTIKEMLLK